MDGSYLLEMNLRSGHGSTSAGAAHGLGEGQGMSGRANEHDSSGSQEAPLLAPHPFSPLPLPPPLPMTHAEMMAELMAARHETASAMELMAQAIAGFAHGGHGGNGWIGGGAHRPEGPSSYQDFLKTHPPTFTPTTEPLDAEHWLRILE